MTVSQTGQQDKPKQPFDEGLKAAREGRFDDAFELWLPIAKAGDPLAMLNIGAVLYGGLHRDKEVEPARVWFDRAAASGQPEIEEAIRLIYEMQDIQIIRSGWGAF